MQEHGELNQTQLTNLVNGARSITIEVAKEMVAEPHISGLEGIPQGRSLIYRWVGKQDLPSLAPTP
jgi:hypothetical protein